LLASVRSGLGSIVQGLSAVLLSTCLAYSDDTHEGLSKEAVVAKIKNHKEGVDALLAALDKFINSDAFSTAIKSHKFVGADPQLYWFDHELAALFRRIVVMTQSAGAEGITSATGGFAGAPAAEKSGKSTVSVDHHELTTNAYKDLITKQDSELADLRARLMTGGGSGGGGGDGADTTAALVALQSQVSAMTSSSAAHEAAAAELTAQLASADVAAKSADGEVSRLREQLDAAMRAAEATAQGKGDEELQAQLQAAQADLGELHNQVHTLTEQLERKDSELLAMSADLEVARVSSAADAEASARSTAQNDLEAVLHDMKQTVDALTAQLAEKDVEIATYQATEISLSTAAGLSGQLQERVNDLEEQLNAQPAPTDTGALEAKVREQQNKLDDQDVLIQEHDDLLICLAEQERKLAEYKEKLRALGQEVSEDEDDDDESEDDDEQ
jgi:hypothetical protein